MGLPPPPVPMTQRVPLMPSWGHVRDPRIGHSYEKRHGAQAFNGRIIAILQPRICNIPYSLPEFLDVNFLGLDHFSGKSKVWTFFGPSTQEVSLGLKPPKQLGSYVATIIYLRMRVIQIFGPKAILGGKDPQGIPLIQTIHASNTNIPTFTNSKWVRYASGKNIAYSRIVWVVNS